MEPRQLLLWLHACAICLSIVLSGGCAGWHGHREQEMLVWLDNPLWVQAGDREFFWNQLVDTVDDYFPIRREDRVRQIGNVLTEGRIETKPVTGATLLEPWRDDSTPGFEIRHATLQSIRRRATVRVWPAEGGYRVEIVVIKELEDVEFPEGAPGGDVVFRSDGSVVRTRPKDSSEPATLGWIPLGRDLSMEQKMLVELQARLGTAGETEPKPGQP